MNLIFSAPIWLIAILVVTLLAAAIEDLVRLRISNITCGIVLVTALLAMALHGFSTSLWQNAVVCIGILIIGMPAFAKGWFGGGDVKLLAALGLWLNLQAALGFLAAVFIAGGIIALIYILIRTVLGVRRRDGRIAYGLAIVAGALFIFGTQFHERSTARFPWQPGFQRQNA